MIVQTKAYSIFKHASKLTLTHFFKCKDGECSDKSKATAQVKEVIDIPKDKLCRKCKEQRATVKLRNDICCK